MDEAGLQTFFCDPLQTFQYSGYTLSGICIDNLNWSPRKKIPENAFFLTLFPVMYISIKHSKLRGRGRVFVKMIDHGISSNPVILIDFLGKIQLGDQSISLI